MTDVRGILLWLAESTERGIMTTTTEATTTPLVPLLRQLAAKRVVLEERRRELAELMNGWKEALRPYLDANEAAAAEVDELVSKIKAAAIEEHLRSGSRRPAPGVRDLHRDHCTQIGGTAMTTGWPSVCDRHTNPL